MIRPDPYIDDSCRRPTRRLPLDPDVLDLVEAEFGGARWEECVRMFLSTALVASEAQSDLRSFDFGFEMGVRCALRDPEIMRQLVLAISYGRQCARNLETDAEVIEAVEFILGDGQGEASGNA